MSYKELLAEGPKLYRTGIEPLDAETPNGLPCNAFGVIRGPGGGGKSVILHEIAKKMMQDGKRVIYVCFEDTPLSVLQNLASLGWNPDILDKGLIELVDCFSAQILRKTPKHEHTIVVRNPTEPAEIADAIFTLIRLEDAPEIAGIFVDSITEFFVQSHPFKAVNAVKAWRATFCKENKIPLWAIYHTGLQQFAAYDDMMVYTSDAIIDTRHEPAFSNAGVLIKQFRVTKLKGASHSSTWVTFNVGKDGIARMTLDEIKSLARSITKIGSPS